MGSHTGNSQILAAPRQLADVLAAGMPISDAALQWQVRSMVVREAVSKHCPTAHAAEACSSLLVMHMQVVDPHAIDNLAPVQDQLAFGHPSGTQPQRLSWHGMMWCIQEEYADLRDLWW